MDTDLYYIVGVAVVIAALYLVAAYLGLGEYLKPRVLRFWERHFGRVTPASDDRQRHGHVEEKLLPNPVADFTGRQDAIDKLVARLRNRETAAITAIDGQGGVGKTELAYYVGVRYVWVHTVGGAEEVTEGLLRTENPRIIVPLTEIFAEL